MKFFNRGLFAVVLMCLAVHPQGHTAYAQQVTATSDDGFRWVSWLTAGERIWKMVMRIEPKMKDVIGDGQTVSVAVQDINHDGQNDVVLHFWGAADCGADGCLYVVLTYDGKTKRGYIGNDIKRSGNGITVDGRYYALYAK